MNSQNPNERAAIVDVENPEPQPAEAKSKKNLALKILALKCAAHLKWNFQILENRFPAVFLRVCLFAVIRGVPKHPLPLQGAFDAAADALPGP